MRKTVKRALKKLNRTQGFTLSETLVAVVILVMISAAALPAALNAYKNAVDAANAQVLLSTTVNALRDELSTAWNVTTKNVTLPDGAKDGTGIKYQSADTGNNSLLYVKDDTIKLVEYGAQAEDWLETDKGKIKTSDARDLVSKAMRSTVRDSGEMKVVYNEIECNNGFVTITGLEVKRGDNTIARMKDDLLIRVMSEH